MRLIISIKKDFMGIVSLFKYKKMSWENRLSAFFSTKYPQATSAYIDRLPRTIDIEWKRDGKFIVGRVSLDDSSFVTQARSAAEFVDMVNDGLFVLCDVPNGYIPAVAEHKKFKPSKKQFAILNDKAIKKSSMQFEREFATI